MIDRFRVQSLTLDATLRLLTARLFTGDEGDPDGTDSGAITNPAAAAEVVGVAPIYSQMGVVARPIVARTLRALGLRDGDDVLVLKLWDRAKTPTDVEEGETRVYACGDTTIRARFRTTGVVIEAKGATITLTNAGAVTITAATGQRVDVQAGTQAFVRGDDYVTALNLWLNAVAALVTALSAVFTALGIYATAIQPIADPTSAATPALLTALGTAWTNAVAVYSGAATAFSNASTTYLSTKIKGE